MTNNVEHLHNGMNTIQNKLAEDIINVIYDQAGQHNMTLTEVVGILEGVKLTIWEEQRSE